MRERQTTYTQRHRRNCMMLEYGRGYWSVRRFAAKLVHGVRCLNYGIDCPSARPIFPQHLGQGSALGRVDRVLDRCIRSPIAGRVETTWQLRTGQPCWILPWLFPRRAGRCQVAAVTRSRSAQRKHSAKSAKSGHISDRPGPVESGLNPAPGPHLSREPEPLEKAQRRQEEPEASQTRQSEAPEAGGCCEESPAEPSSRGRSRS